MEIKERKEGRVIVALLIGYVQAKDKEAFLQDLAEEPSEDQRERLEGLGYTIEEVRSAIVMLIGRPLPAPKPKKLH